MTEEHRTEIQVDLDTGAAEARLKRLSRAVKDFERRTRSAGLHPRQRGGLGGRGGGARGGVRGTGAASHAIRAASTPRVGYEERMIYDAILAMGNRMARRNRGRSGGFSAAGGGYGGGGGGYGGGFGGGGFGPPRGGAGASVGVTHVGRGGGRRRGGLGGMGGAFGASLPFLGALFGFRIAGLQRRYELARQGADVTHSLGLASLVGGAPGGLSYGTGKRYGLSAAESAQMRSQFFQSAGYRGALKGQRLAALSRSSLSTGAMGSYLGLGAPGAGGVKGNLEQMVRIAQTGNLFGSKGDQYLQIVAQATTRMAERGMTLDLAATESFLARFTGAGKDSAGLSAARLAGGLTGAAGSARDQLMAPFQSMGQAALLAKAMQGGGGFLDIVGRLSNLSAPGKAAEAIRGMFGESMSANVFASMGATPRLALDVARNKARNPAGTNGLNDLIVAPGGNRGLFTKAEADMMAQAGKDPKAMIQRYNKYQGLLVQAGGDADDFVGAVKGVVVELGKDSLDAMGAFIEQVGEAIGKAIKEVLF